MLEYIKYARCVIHTKPFLFHLSYLGPLSFYNVRDEVRHGLASTFVIICPVCGKNNEIKTSEQHKSGQRGPPAFDVNTRVALGCLHAGIGQTHINNLLSTLNAPTINSVTFKLREREVGKAVEGVAKSSCQDYLVIEKQEALQNGVQVDDNNLVPISCSYDMGWQKRGKGHNSRTGQGAVMGLLLVKCWTIQQGQKVVDFVTVPRPWEKNPKLMTAEKIMRLHRKQWSLLQQLNCLTELQTKVLSFQFTQVMMTPQQRHTYEKK